jgi:hypothetical protein
VPATVPAEQAFVVTVGVPHKNTQAHCKRALTVLHQAGYEAGPTSNESLLALADQVQLTTQLEENDTDATR